MRSHSSRSHPPRRGYGLVEMAVTGVLLTAMALLSARVASTVATQRLTTTRREAAVRLAADLVEEARSLSWDRLTTERIRPLAEARLADVASLVNSRATVRVAVDPAPGVAGTESRRVVVTVGWPDPGRGAGAPIRLAGWAFAPAPAGGDRP